MFPLLALPLGPALVGVIAGGVQTKLVLALSYSIPIVVFLLVFWKDIDRYRHVPLRLQELFLASKETLLQELERQQEAYHEVEYEKEIQARLINAVGEAVIATDLQGKITFLNAAAERIYGWKREEVMGRSVVEVTPSEDSRNAASAIMSELQQGKSWSGEFRVKRRHGEAFPALVTNSPLTDQTGKLIGIIGISRDITAQKAIENSLRESEERLRLALSAANQGLYDLNVQTGETKVNDQYALMLGYDPDEFQETNAAWIERLHPDDREPVAQVYRDYVSGKLPEYRVEFRQRTESGDWIWILSLGKIVERDADGQPLRMLGTHTNITERKNAEDRISSTLAYVKTIIDSSPIGLVTYKASGEAVSTNEAVAAIIGTTPAQVLEQNFRELESWKKSGMLSAAEKAFTTGKLQELEVNVVSTFGKMLNLECRFVPFEYLGERQLLTIILDITERKQVEDALKKSEAKYRELFYLLPAGVFTKDQDGRYTSTNDLKKMYTDIDPIGRTDFDLQPEHIARQLQDNDLLVMERGQTLSFEEQFLAPDGMRWMLAHKTPLRDEEGRIVGILGATQDITESKQIAEKLAESEFKYRNLVETAHDLIWTIDPEGIITFMNRASERIYGYKPEELIGQHWTVNSEELDLEEATRIAQEIAQEGGAVDGYISIMRHRDGHQVILRANAVQLYDEQDNIQVLLEHPKISPISSSYKVKSNSRANNYAH